MPQGTKSRTRLIPWKGNFFVNVFFTEAQQKQTDSSSLSYYPEEFFSLSQERGEKKVLRSQVDSDEAIKQNGNEGKSGNEILLI